MQICRYAQFCEGPLCSGIWFAACACALRISLHFLGFGVQACSHVSNPSPFPRIPHPITPNPKTVFVKPKPLCPFPKFLAPFHSNSPPETLKPYLLNVKSPCPFPQFPPNSSPQIPKQYPDASHWPPPTPQDCGCTISFLWGLSREIFQKVNVIWIKKLKSLRLAVK